MLLIVYILSGTVQKRSKKKKSPSLSIDCLTMDVSSNGTAAGTILYQYVPSQNTAYAYMALFGAETAVHLILMFVFRAAFFIPMVIGGVSKYLLTQYMTYFSDIDTCLGTSPRVLYVCTNVLSLVEVGGYYGRAWSHRDPHSVKAYVLQSLLILSAPPFLAGTIYMSLGRIIVSLRAEGYSIVRPRWLTPLFVLVDVVCFLTQMGGAGVQVSGSGSLRVAGQKIVLGGLILQIIVFSFFVFIAYGFHLRNSRQPATILSSSTDPAGISIKWRRQMWALYVVSVFVLARNIFRIAEFTGAGTGFINTHEAMVYVFDATLMWLVMVVFGFVHPGKLRKDIRNAEKRTSPFSDDHAMLMLNDGDANSGQNRF